MKPMQQEFLVLVFKLPKLSLIVWGFEIVANSKEVLCLSVRYFTPISQTRAHFLLPFRNPRLPFSFISDWRATSMGTRAAAKHERVSTEKRWRMHFPVARSAPRKSRAKMIWWLDAYLSTWLLHQAIVRQTVCEQRNLNGCIKARHTLPSRPHVPRDIQTFFSEAGLLEFLTKKKSKNNTTTTAQFKTCLQAELDKLTTETLHFLLSTEQLLNTVRRDGNIAKPVKALLSQCSGGFYVLQA